MCEQVVEATTAEVLIAFQKVPGVDSDDIINGGDAALQGSDRPVRPQGDGYYGLNMAAGSTRTLSLFGTTYTIRHVQGDEEEPPGGDDEICLTAWDTLGDNTTDGGVGQGADIQMGIQRRLQLLGYYTGLVDGTMNKDTEEAILRFQADNNLRTDGWVGPNTRRALNTVTNNGTVTDGTNVIRRSLVRFERAPDDSHAEIPWARAPEPDCRGFIERPSAGIDLKGPVVTMARGYDFRIKLIRECISNAATLTATSEDTDLVEVVSPQPLPNDRQIILTLRTGNLSGSDPRHTSVKIHAGNRPNHYEVASLQVIVMPRIYKEIRPHWVTIDGAATVVRGANLSRATPPSGTQANLDSALRLVNHILWPYGIFFSALGWREKRVTLSHAGQITWADVNEEFRTINEANDTEGNTVEDDKVNVYVVRHIDGALGISFSTRVYEWPYVGIAISSGEGGRDSTYGDIAIWLAHELGHFMGLSDYFVDPPHPHTEDDPDESHKKSDIWTLSRLMVGLWPTTARAGDNWAHNVGYGHNTSGCMLSVRDLQADRTDNECHNARRHANSLDFYRNR